MTTPVQIFEKACGSRWLRPPKNRPFGPRFSPIPEEDQERILLEMYRGMAAKAVNQMRPHFPRLIEIYFDYIDNGELNAVADVISDPDTGKVGYIGMFRGTPLLLRDFFQRMLSHPDVLPSLGNAKGESLNIEHTEGVVLDIKRLRKKRSDAGRSIETVVPNDMIRLLFAHYVTMVALDFLIFHEFAHIVNGHCDYIESLRAKNPKCQSFILEANQQSASPFPLMARQMLERNADIFAANKSFASVAGFGKSDQKEHPFVRFCSTPKDASFAWAFAVFSIFMFWGIEIDPSDLERRLYPPTAIRANTAANVAMESVIEKLYPEQLKECGEACASAYMEVSNAFRCIGGFPPPDEDIRNGMMDQRTLIHLKKLFDVEDALFPKVFGYGYHSFNPTKL